MEIFKAGARPTDSGSADYFIGDVTMDPIVSAPEPARVRALLVRFAPGARTAWHTHPLGQTLHVVSGAGYVQKAGEAARQILPGDTVWIAPGEKHWHGATENNAMAHIAIHEALDGSNVTWLEHVSDEDYAAANG
ncbi:(R)-mandelonitrile lyase [Hoeflea poritis]|uniref:Cupin domain-containing protein n=1 Tax=Hoeflea poritis TaxID=2993659 RepID=A0ABT4VN91_9HYPH|nr:cupin domain-containing protein [Hoeflea poritis]MDA4846149.1 cupin domain-containing protein [Hoeflea poritis]